MTLITRGDRELAQRFDEFPSLARAKLTAKITSLIQILQSRIQAATPYKSGRLRSEIAGRVYADQPTRIAGYVGVRAQIATEYAKAATLEYGSDAVRKRVSEARNRLIERVSKPVHIKEYAYLRGPFAAMRDEIEADVAEALKEAAQESNAST